MKIKHYLLIALVLVLFNSNAQPVEVQYDYNAVGDCIFSAENNSKSQVYLHVNFADLQNTSFPETLPYVVRLTPGFNALFTLQRDLDADVPRFNYDVKSFRSNPMAVVDLNYPYLIPFAEKEKVRVFDVEDINGFRGSTKLESWSAIGFYAKSGAGVYACRNGVVVEITGAKRSDDPQTWYNGWNNNITIMQPDGTLMCYRNVLDKAKKLKLGASVYAGQQIGEIAANSNGLEILIYHHSINKKGLMFVIPQFINSDGKKCFVNAATEYSVVHPLTIRGMEMTKRERKKILGLKK